MSSPTSRAACAATFASVPNCPFIMLEHVNVNIGSVELAKTFYFETLCAGEDPRPEAMMQRRVAPGASGLVWANLGLQQMHLPMEGTAQALRGEIFVDYPDVDALQYIESRLRAAEERLAGTRFKWERNEEGLRVVCPWGNEFCLRTQVAEPSEQPRWYGPWNTLSPSTLPGHPCVNAPLPLPRPLGIRGLRFKVAVGSALGIGKFYEKFFQCSPELVEDSEGLWSCQIQMGCSQTVEFAEQQGEIPEYDGHHIAVYITSFDECYRRLAEAGLLYNNPRFPTLTYETLERAQGHNEFRILEIRDPEDLSTVLYSLEHEIRHPLHTGFPLKEFLPVSRTEFEPVASAL